MPAFWGYPPPPHDYTYRWSQVNRRQSQSYKFKEFAKISNHWILKQTLHVTHLLKLLNKMCKDELDPASIVEDTARALFCLQTDRRPDGQGETSIPFNFVESRGIIMIRWLWELLIFIMGIPKLVILKLYIEMDDISRIIRVQFFYNTVLYNKILH